MSAVSGIEYPKVGRGNEAPASYIAMIAEMRERGWTYARIAKAVGRSQGAVVWQCHQHGIEGPNSRRRERWTPGLQFTRGSSVIRRFTVEEDRVLTDLAMQGLSYAEMGRRLSRGVSSVRARLVALARLEERALG